MGFRAKPDTPRRTGRFLGLKKSDLFLIKQGKGVTRFAHSQTQNQRARAGRQMPPDSAAGLALPPHQQTHPERQEASGQRLPQRGTAKGLKAA